VSSRTCASNGMQGREPAASQGRRKRVAKVMQAVLLAFILMPVPVLLAFGLTTYTRCWSAPLWRRGSLVQGFAKAQTRNRRSVTRGWGGDHDCSEVHRERCRRHPSSRRPVGRKRWLLQTHRRCTSRERGCQRRGVKVQWEGVEKWVVGKWRGAASSGNITCLS
jgi:hypothetical protein